LLGHAEVNVSGSINVTASTTNVNGDALAAFALSNAITGTSSEYVNYQTSDNFNVHLTSAAVSAGSDYLSSYIESSVPGYSELNLGHINITASSDKSSAEAYFASGEVDNNMRVDISAYAVAEDAGYEDAGVNASLAIGDISIVADAKDNARAGFVSASLSGYADLAELNIDELNKEIDKLRKQLDLPKLSPFLTL
jgi:hypothetical protein